MNKITRRDAATSATPGPLDDDLLARMDAWWRAANSLFVGQIYLLGNPRLREPLAPVHVKPRLLGQFGPTPGLNFVWLHLNRVIRARARALNVIYVAGPGHGAPGLLASRVIPTASRGWRVFGAVIQSALCHGRA